MYNINQFEDLQLDLIDLRRNEQIAEQLLRQDIQEELLFGNQPGIGRQINEILSIFLTRRQDILELIEDYGIPRRISRLLTRRIIAFVLRNAAQVPGSPAERVQILYNRFTNTDRVVVPILRLFGVPENVIGMYIRRVIRVTLNNIVTIPPQPGIEAQVREILRDLEANFPNLFGLTTTFGIPIGIARNIISDIIRFTLLNVNRIPATGTIQNRANQMLRLLDAESPQLIEQMIRRGVPAARAEQITQGVIAFTLRAIS